MGVAVVEQVAMVDRARLAQLEPVAWVAAHLVEWELAAEPIEELAVRPYPARGSMLRFPLFPRLFRSRGDGFFNRVLDIGFTCPSAQDGRCPWFVGEQRYNCRRELRTRQTDEKSYDRLEMFAGRLGEGQQSK